MLTKEKKKYDKLEVKQKRIYSGEISQRFDPEVRRDIIEGILDIC